MTILRLLVLVAFLAAGLVVGSLNPQRIVLDFGFVEVVTTTGVAHCEASGNSPRQNRSIPKVPILSRMQTSSTEVPGVAFSVVSASQVCSGNSGAFTANAIMKPTNSQRSHVVLMSTFWRSESRYDGVPASADTT